MATIHFSSGKTRDIDSGRLDKFIIDLKGRGIKMMVDRTPTVTLIVPLNSNTMEFIEDIHEVPEVSTEPDVEVIDEDKELKKMKEELVASAEEMKTKRDPEEKQKDAADEMMAKSNCTHPAEQMEIYRHVTTKGSRYFPVCAFCGKRERYVKADSLDDATKEAAKLWED